MLSSEVLYTASLTIAIKVITKVAIKLCFEEKFRDMFRIEVLEVPFVKAEIGSCVVWRAKLFKQKSY